MVSKLSLDNGGAMIVKVQRSLFSSGGQETVFIYDQSRSINVVLPMSKKLLRKLDGSYKRYFHADLRHGRLELGRPAAEQNW